MSTYPKFEALHARFDPMVDLYSGVDEDVEWIFGLEEHDRFPVWTRWDQIEALRNEPSDEKNAYLLGVSLIHMRRAAKRVCELANRRFYLSVTVWAEDDEDDAEPARMTSCVVNPDRGGAGLDEIRIERATGSGASEVATWLSLLDDAMVEGLVINAVVNPVHSDVRSAVYVDFAQSPCEYVLVHEIAGSS